MPPAGPGCEDQPRRPRHGDHGQTRFTRSRRDAEGIVGVASHAANSRSLLLSPRTPPLRVSQSPPAAALRSVRGERRTIGRPIEMFVADDSPPARCEPEVDCREDDDRSERSLAAARHPPPSYSFGSTVSARRVGCAHQILARRAVLQSRWAEPTLRLRLTAYGRRSALPLVNAIQILVRPNEQPAVGNDRAGVEE
jgi:hypothetical protein